MFLLLTLMLSAGGGYYLYRQNQENALIDDFTRELGLQRVVSWENAVEISQKLRETFNSDKKSFSKLSLKNKPFLREECDELIEAREGLCGEGTRVLVCILDRLGFDAARVTLFTKWLHPSHTLVSIVVNGEEYFIDSMNSGEEFNAYINQHQISADDFQIMGHVEDIRERTRLKHELKEQDMDVDLARLLTDKYLFYSYESLPFSKLLGKLGMNMRVLNLSRPPRWISVIGEKPKLIKSSGLFLAAFLCILMAAIF